MSTDDAQFLIPADIEERSNRVYARMVAGEVLTNDEVAAALGIPAEFLAASVAVYLALMGREPVIVDPVARLTGSKLN